MFLILVQESRKPKAALLPCSIRRSSICQVLYWRHLNELMAIFEIIHTIVSSCALKCKSFGNFFVVVIAFSLPRSKKRKIHRRWILWMEWCLLSRSFCCTLWKSDLLFALNRDPYNCSSNPKWDCESRITRREKDVRFGRVGRWWFCFWLTQLNHWDVGRCL